MSRLPHRLPRLSAHRLERTRPSLRGHPFERVGGDGLVDEPLDAGRERAELLRLSEPEQGGSLR